MTAAARRRVMVVLSNLSSRQFLATPLLSEATGQKLVNPISVQCAGDRVRRACPPGSYCQGTFNILLDFLLTFSPPPTQCHFFSNFESDFDFINQCFPSLQIEINY